MIVNHDDDDDDDKKTENARSESTVLIWYRCRSFNPFAGYDRMFLHGQAIA
jgi:hypothetical protein